MNALEFTMGLNSANFIKNVLAAETVMGGLRVIAEGVEAVFRKMDSAIERAAGLEQLSKRTGESVGALYKLQEGFEAVGLSADSIPTMLLRLQNSLSGVNEMGQRTGSIFARIGLDRQSLARMDASGQINAITAALNKLPKAQMSGMAMQIFGRFGAGDIMQIARSGDAWRESQANAQKYAALMEKLAPLAEKYEQTLKYTKMQWDAIWSVVALNILPVMQRLLEQVKKLDVSKFIADLEKVGKGIAGAIIEGHVEELLEDSLAAAWEQGKYYGERVFYALAAFFGDALMAVLSAVFVNLAGMLATALANGLAIGVSKVASKMDDKVISDANKMLKTIDEMPEEAKKNLPPGEVEHWKQMITDAGSDKAVQSGTQQGLMQQIGDSAAQNIHDGLKKIAAGAIAGVKDAEAEWDKTAGNQPHPAWDKLKKDLLTYGAALGNLDAMTVPLPEPAAQNVEQSHYKPEFTSFEKMGFVMSGLGNPFESRKISLLEKIVENTKPASRVESGWTITPVNQV
jgi:uncharacterized protein with HEPN domain